MTNEIEISNENKDSDRLSWLLSRIVAFECDDPALVISWPYDAVFNFSDPIRSIDGAMQHIGYD